MNKIYQSLRLFTNFFLPVMQLTHKTRQGAKVTRSYDTPCTPYERVLTSPCIMEQAKEVLRDWCLWTLRSRSRPTSGVRDLSP